MINFFRRLRQKLLSDGKFTKYLLYAIGEIILVVIGILIAIQLNTWKTEADENTIVLRYLDGLLTDLEQDYARMDTLYIFYTDKTNSIQRLLHYNVQSKPIPNDELGALFNAILEYKKFSNKKSTYLSLINDGFINRINNKVLIGDIIKYYESPYLTWSTEIYENKSESINYAETEIYNSNDRLIGLNQNNAIPGWTLTNENYRTNYAELVQSKWARDVLTDLLKQSNFIFNNLNNYRKMNKQLRAEIKRYD